jgi:hypothetical protein
MDSLKDVLSPGSGIATRHPDPGTLAEVLAEQGPASNQQGTGTLLDEGSKVIQDLAQAVSKVADLAQS